MGQFDDVVAVPRRTMMLLFVVDTSGSMSGDKIGSLNVAVQEVLPMIAEISENNADAQIKVAVLEFSSGTEWMYEELGPVEAENFQWRDLEASGLTSLGEACEALNTKLSTKGYMSEATGSFAPVIILLSDGEPTDDYKRGLSKLQGNRWFKSGIKVAIAIGEDANRDILAEFTGHKESVLTVHNKEQLKKIIHFVSVTASQVASRSSSVGIGAEGEKAPDKQKDLNDKIADIVNNDDNTDGAFTGVDVGTGPSTGSDDDWGKW